MKRSEVSRVSRKLFGPKILIKPSLIPGAGDGAFAYKFIPKDTILGDYIGDECSEDSDGDYVLYVAGYNAYGEEIERCINAENKATSNWTRYINSIKQGDGRTKNAKFIVRGRDTVSVKTIKDIQAGEEILVDYGNEYWN